MKKETQTQIMKPIKVFSLVLLALLLLVPAASAETYTLIDEDLVFGGGSGSGGGIDSVEIPEYFFPHGLQLRVHESETSLVITTDSSELEYIIDSTTGESFIIDCFGTYLNGEKVVNPDSPYYTQEILPGQSFYYAAGRLLAGNDNVPPDYQDSYYGERVYHANNAVREVAISLSLAYPDCPVCVVGPINTPLFWYLYMPVGESVPALTQHVTVTYDDQSENYQVYVDTSDESVDVWVHGYLFGWFPVYTLSSNSFPPSTHFEWLTLPVQWMLWNIDWEVKVEFDGESQVLKWNQDI